MATVFLLALAVLIGWQRPPALACVMDDAGCRDHCAIVAMSCATACPARLAPAPVECPVRRAVPQAIAFSFDRPVSDGRSIAPETTPPRFVA